MKQCPNCGGALDNNGKCLACGTVTELKLSSEDGVVLNCTPECDKAWEDYIEAINQEPAQKSLKDIVSGFNDSMTAEEKKRIIDEFANTPSIYPISYEECIKAMDNINRIKREAKL